MIWRGRRWLPRQRAYSIRTRIKTHPLSSSQDTQGLCQRAYSIRTRIKTQDRVLNLKTVAVREHIPLEQGLRPILPHNCQLPRLGQRAYSIRTRIKTIVSCVPTEESIYCQRAYSIRTRIKTQSEVRTGTLLQVSESIFH